MTISTAARRAMLTASVLAFWATPASAATAPPAAGPLRLAWAGDIAFDSRAGLPAGGPQAALRPVRSMLRADLTMGNLEGTLGTSGTSKCRGGAANCYAFQAPPGYAQGLRAAGFDLLDQANNHANDAGPAGILATHRALRHAGLLRAGIGAGVTRLTVRGVRVAVVGFSPYPWSPSLLDLRRARRIVQRADRGADVVVVLAHAGAEGAGRTHVRYGTERAFGENRGDPRRFAHAVVGAGADLVLGSGPHVLRGIERFNGRMIAYSLGNFAGPRTLGFGGLSSRTGVLRVDVDVHGRTVAGRLLSATLVPPGLPRPDPAHRAAALVANLSREDFGAARFQIHRDGTFDAREHAPGRPRR